MGFRVTATTVIAARPEQVWAALIDLAGYGRWNTFTPNVRSTLEVGAPVHLEVVLGPRRRTRSINHVEAVEAPKRIVWGSVLLHARLLRTRRTQTVESVEDGCCRYTTSETFDGPLAPLVALVARSAVERGFAAVAEGLRGHLEGDPRTAGTEPDGER